MKIFIVAILITFLSIVYCKESTITPKLECDEYFNTYSCINNSLCLWCFDNERCIKNDLCNNQTNSYYCANYMVGNYECHNPEYDWETIFNVLLVFNVGFIFGLGLINCGIVFKDSKSKSIELLISILSPLILLVNSTISVLLFYFTSLKDVAVVLEIWPLVIMTALIIIVIIGTIYIIFLLIKDWWIERKNHKSQIIV